MKKALLFLLGAFSCYIVLSIIGYYPHNNELVPPIANNNKDIQEDSTVEYYEYTDKDIEKRIKISSPIIINGEVTPISSFELDGIIYVSVEELGSKLNNLKVHLPDEESNDKGLVIYENSGLGIVAKNNEKYIEISNLAHRYTISPYSGLPFVYQSVGGTFLDCNNDNHGITKKLETAYFVNGMSSESLFVKMEDFEKEKLLYLKIISENESVIYENPNVLIIN